VNTVFLVWQSCRYMMRSYTLGEPLARQLEETTVPPFSLVKSHPPHWRNLKLWNREGF
jgi:hypothetical protein